MALVAARLRVPPSQKRPAAAFVRNRSTAINGSIVDAKTRVREHARHISRTTVANATPAPPMSVSNILRSLHPPHPLSAAAPIQHLHTNPSPHRVMSIYRPHTSTVQGPHPTCLWITLSLASPEDKFFMK